MAFSPAGGVISCNRCSVGTQSDSLSANLRSQSSIDLGTPPARSSTFASQYRLPRTFPLRRAESCRRDESRIDRSRFGSRVMAVAITRKLIAWFRSVPRVTLQEGAPHGRAPSGARRTPAQFPNGISRCGLPTSGLGFQELPAHIAELGHG